MNQQPSGSFPDNPYISLRIGLHDYMLNLAPFFSPDWFTDAFINLFGYPCYILTQCAIYFSTALFLQFAFNTLISIYRSFTVRNLLKKQIAVVSALGFGFFGTTTQTMRTAMIESSDSHSDSEDFDSPQSPPSNSHTKSLNSKPKSSNCQPNFKTKLLSLKHLNLRHRSLPTKPLLEIHLLSMTIVHLHLLIIIPILSLIRISLLVTLNHLHYLPLHISIIFLFPMTLIVTIPPMIPPP